MEYGISKCVVINVSSIEIELLTGESMYEPDASGYKYLGILEFDDILTKDMKTKVKEGYFNRLKLILKSKLNSRNLLLGINSWAESY